jgi:hypothetical protein
VDHVPDSLLLRKFGSSENRTQTSKSVARNSDHYTTDAVPSLRKYKFMMKPLKAKFKFTNVGQMSFKNEGQAYGVNGGYAIGRHITF